MVALSKPGFEWLGCKQAQGLQGIAILGTAPCTRSRSTGQIRGLNLRNFAELKNFHFPEPDPKTVYPLRDSSEPSLKRATANSAGCSVAVAVVVAAGAAAGPA